MRPGTPFDLRGFPARSPLGVFGPPMAPSAHICFRTLTNLYLLEGLK